MLLVVFHFVLVVVATFTIALDLQHEDLNDPTKICGVGNATCDPTKTASLRRNFTNRNCMCDRACATYGDCCEDSPYFNDAEQRRAVTEYNCMYYDDLGSYYVRQSCPTTWTDTEYRRKCERSKRTNIEDPLQMTPVTDRRSNITYGNIFCAICNGRPLGSQHLDVWQIGFKCPNNAPTRQHDVASLNFNKTGSYWQLIEPNQTVACSFHLVIPTSSHPKLVSCERNLIKTCPASWIHEQPSRHAAVSTSNPNTALPSRESIRTSCESYTMVVYPAVTTTVENHPAYRNVHCAICNSITVQDLVCKNDNVFRFGPMSPNEIPSFSILFDFNSIMNTGKKNCGPGLVYDGLLKTCRDDINKEQSRSLVPPVECASSMTVETNFTFVDNNNIYVPHHNKTYLQNEYVYHDHNQSVSVCKSGGGGAAQIEALSKYPIHFRVISAVGIAVSIICLLAHLIAFALLKELRNLSGKNLASLCFSLLAAYSSFILANSLENTACIVNAVVTYYFFLAAFSWMLIMSFDVWRSLKIATKELRVSSGKQWRKFFIYSACGWLVPAKFVLVALVVDLCPVGVFGQRFQPNFGRQACWFNNGQSLLLFFILPVFLTLICNVSFFVFSALMIYSSHSMTRYSASPATKRDFRLYARLSLIMGLTWITGLVAGLANNNVLWILFIMSNAFLGLFIFLAFTWRKAVLHGLKNLKRDSVLNLPAFSWTVNSNSSAETKSQARSEGKSTSNTYY